MLRSTLCAFDISPMEKNRKTASLKHRINGKQKKNARPTARKIVKCKEKVRLPWKKIKNVKGKFFLQTSKHNRC